MFPITNTCLLGNLTDYFNMVSSPGTAQKIENVITALSLPVPGEGEFLQTREGGALIYLEDQGCVIRITHNNQHPYNKNDFVLRPLAALQADHFRIHINPGLPCPVNPDEIGDLVAILADDKLGFHDCFPENAGYLPYKTVEFPNGIPVVIDEPAVNILRDDIADIFAKPLNDRQKSAQASARNIQDQLFEPLRKAFHKAWPMQNECSIQENMIAFWDLCKEMKAQGMLVDSWNKTTDKRILRKSPIEISAKYAAKIRSGLSAPKHR